MSSYSYYRAYPTKSHPKRTNDVLTWPVWKSYDLQQSQRIKFLPVWNGFFGDDIKSKFLFDFSCFFASNLTQVFVEEFVDFGLVWSAKKCSKLNFYSLLILNIILLIWNRCQKLRFYRLYLWYILNMSQNIFENSLIIYDMSARLTRARDKKWNFAPINFNQIKMSCSSHL